MPVMTTTPTAPDFDILDPHFYDDPWETYRWLRTNDPVHWDERNGLWVVSKHEDVVHISRHTELYCSSQGVRPVLDVPLSIIAMDDPEHTRVRRLINRGFTPARVRELTGHMRELTTELIDDIAQRGEIDFVEDFAIHLPLIIIAELIGLDPSQRQQLYQWSDAMMNGEGHTAADDPALIAAATAFGEYSELCTGLIAERRGQPVTEDLISILTNAYDEGVLVTGVSAAAGEAGADGDSDAEGTLDDDELFMFLCLLVVAGNETTRNALTGGLLAFSQFPEERDRLIAEPALIDSAVEEIVRYVTPVISFTRTITETHEYKGRTFVEGQKVLMLYQSANRDEDVFEAADEFRIDRDPNPHVGFGIGTHFCLGANLARAEINVVFEQLFQRLHDIHVPDGVTPPRGENTLVIALKHLPAVFTPEKTLA
jgi:cytochrome P450 family 142 subfamily A polypeptide 1